MYLVEVLNALANLEELELFLLCSPEFEWQQISGVRTLPVLQGLSHSIPVVRKARFVTAQWWNPVRLIKAIEKEHIDIVHLQSFHHLSFAQWKKAADNSRAKWVIAAHDIKREVAILHKGWEDEQLKACYRFADALLVHSNHQKEELIEFAGVMPSRIHLVPHGPYVYQQPEGDQADIRSALGIPESVDIALFFGQIRNDKNLESFLNAVTLADTNTHVIVAGQAGGHHEGAAYYQALCEEFHISDRVHFYFGHIPDEEVGKFFVAADWIALPYQRSFTSQSGVLNIAAQFDRPVLVSNAPVLKETVEDSGIGYACDDDTVNALRKGIAEMQKVKTAVSAEDFERYRQTYSWEQNARITASLYRALMQ